MKRLQAAAGMRRAGRKPHVLVTAGPTHEPIDPVRFLANRSSGKMGFAIAEAAARLGCRVTLIAGPVELKTPPGVERIDVETAREMLCAARRAFRKADVLYMAAAVADWRPARRRAGKWRAKDSGSPSTSLELVRNPDILASLARRKGRRLVVGFALETGAGLRRARAKLLRKCADVIVLNDSTALGAARTTVTVLGRDGSHKRIENQSKRSIAQALVRLCLRTP